MRLLLALGLFAFAGQVCLRAQAADSSPASAIADASARVAELLSVGGEVPHPLSFSRADLLKLPRVEVRSRDRNGRENTYSGTPLAKVLRAGGLKFDPAAMPGRSAEASYVLVEARDGYKALFALAEIDPTQSDHVILLADSKDGVPFDEKEGPLRLIVPGDKRPARWVRQVTAISVHRG